MNSPESFDSKPNGDPAPSFNQAEMDKALASIEDLAAKTEELDAIRDLGISEKEAQAIERYERNLLRKDHDSPKSETIKRPMPAVPMAERTELQESFGFVKKMNQMVKEGTLQVDGEFALDTVIQDLSGKDFSRELVALYSLKAIDLLRKENPEWLFELGDVNAVTIAPDHVKGEDFLLFDVIVNLKPNIVERVLRWAFKSSEPVIKRFSFYLDQKGEVSMVWSN